MRLVDIGTRKLHYTNDEDDDVGDVINTLCGRMGKFQKEITGEGFAWSDICRSCQKRAKQE